MTAPLTVFPVATAGGYGENALVMTNAAGNVDPSFLSTESAASSPPSSGAGKFVVLNAEGFVDPSLFQGISSSAGAQNQGMVPLLNSQGILDSSFFSALSGGGGAQPYLDIAGWRFLQGTGTIPGQSGGRSASATINFPSVNGSQAFTSAPMVIATANTNLGSGARGDNPVLIVGSTTATGFNADINSNDSNNSQTFPTVTVTYLAIGQTPVT